MSDSLVGKHVTVTAAGEVRLVAAGRGGGNPADAVDDDEGRLGAMEYAHLEAIRRTYDALPHKTLARDAFRAGTPFERIDGMGWWVEAESLFDMCFGDNFSLSAGNRCVRLASRPMLTGALTVARVLYKSPPAWTRFEGAAAQVA